MPRKKTNIEFLEQIEKLVGTEYKVLEEYKGNNIKLEFKHNKCGKTFLMKPFVFITLGSRCPHCGNKKLGKEGLQQKLNIAHKNQYTVIGEYISKNKPLSIKCNKCNSIINVSPRVILKEEYICRNCKGYKPIHRIYNSKNNKSHELFEKQFYDLVGREYELLEKYKSGNEKILARHNVCNKVIEITPKNFLQGTRCSYCKFRRTQAEFNDLVKKEFGDDFIVAGEYINSKTKISIKHTRCNKVFDILPSNLKRLKTLCPHCKLKKNK